jgi:1-acyl-sn-glycerol-3-phosphate acyltransferase
MLRSIVRTFFYMLGSFIQWLFIKVTVVGRENIPQDDEPLIIICNHFSWFEAPAIIKFLPYKTIFIAAVELLEHPVVRLMAYGYEIIPIWRGQVDRQAIRKALHILANGGTIGIFPEGGIDPDLREKTLAGEITSHSDGRAYREKAQLIPARPGASYLAIRSQARILPVSVLNGEKVLPNMRRLRRTHITMKIGPVFGPLTLESSLHGAVKREIMDDLGDEMMQHIAALLPIQNRGHYA